MKIKKNIAAKWNLNYIVKQSDIEKVVSYVNGRGGYCHVQSPIRFLKQRFPNVNWPRVVDAGVQQGVLHRQLRLLSTQPISKVKLSRGMGKKIPVLLLSCTFSMFAFAEPYVTNVVARQRQPWNGLVDVSYEIVGSTNGMEYAYGQLTATDRTHGKTYAASTFEKKIDLSEGKHTAIWNMAADNSFTSKDIVFNLSIRIPALYCVIDLSGGPNATSYPVMDLDDVPEGGWTDEYKTTKLVMRRINPGTFIMGKDQADESHRVWITKPFYIGVFEVTQKQYELVIGNNPSRYKGDMRPLESVSFSSFHGCYGGGAWPCEGEGNTFLACLREKTGVRLDLPTEAQWEYSCRAGTTSAYNNGGSSEEDLKLLGRYAGNQSDGKGGCSQHTVVGLYMPNYWGLYDMHGNVREWCCDCNTTMFGIDPVGNRSDNHGVRGGKWDNSAAAVMSCDRYTDLYYYYSEGLGFRISGCIIE